MYIYTMPVLMIIPMIFEPIDISTTMAGCTNYTLYARISAGVNVSMPIYNYFYCLSVQLIPLIISVVSERMHAYNTVVAYR